jgi:hypothetical protein
MGLSDHWVLGSNNPILRVACKLPLQDPNIATRS